MAEAALDQRLDDEKPYALSAAFWDELNGAIAQQDHSALVAILDRLHVADIADAIEQADEDTREGIIKLWGNEIDGLVLTELDEGVREDVMGLLPYRTLVEALQELDTDDVVYILEDLEEKKQQTLLRGLDDADRAAVSQSLTYSEGSAGRIMQRDFVLAPEHWTAGDVVDYFRKSPDLPENFYAVYVVNPFMTPLGMVPLAKILTAVRKTKVTSLMDTDFQSIPVDQSQEDVAYAFNQYHMVTAPVVDADDRIVGIITIDDAMEILGDEAEEDIMRLGGVGDEELSDNVWETTKLRFPWLFVNLLTAILASLVISQFSDTINAIVALAVLMPIVASMGGNAGTQTLTVAVRALATKDLTRANAFRIVSRELLVGLANGLIFAIIIGIVGLIWFGSPMLGVVLGAAMVVNLVIAGLAGILIPIALEKLGADPALASGAFVTTVTDVVGFFCFLGLAAWLLV